MLEMTAKTSAGLPTRTHDGRLVFPSGAELPFDASGWTNCDNRGGGYSVWLDADDVARSKADLTTIEKRAKSLRTRAGLEAALRELYIEPYGTVETMRNTYIITAYEDLWPLRQVARGGSMKPTSLSEVLHHLADGGVVSVNTSDANGGNTVEFRFVDGFESRLPDQEWFPCATTLLRETKDEPLSAAEFIAVKLDTFLGCRRPF